MKKILIIGLLFIIPSISSAAFDVSLKYGSNGSAVVELQEFLIDQSCLKGEATGNFFSLTLRAVKCFQTANGLPSTGFFGPMSRTVANSLIAVETASSTAQEIAETGTTTPVAVVAPVATTTIIQYITYNTPAPVVESVVAPVVGAPQPVVKPAPVARLMMGANDVFRFTKDAEWTTFDVNYLFAGGKVTLLSLGIYPDEPNAKELVGITSKNDSTYSFSSAQPIPAGKYVVKAIVAGTAQEALGQKLQMWTTSADIVTLENK